MDDLVLPFHFEELYVVSLFILYIFSWKMAHKSVRTNYKIYATEERPKSRNTVLHIQNKTKKCGPSISLR